MNELCETCAHADVCTYAEAVRALNEKGRPAIEILVAECRLYTHDGADG